MTRPLRIAVIAAANLILLALLLAALEVGTRILAPRWVPTTAGAEAGFDSLVPVPYQWAIPPANLDVRVQAPQQRRPGRLTHIVTDRFGFRFQGDLTRPKRPGEYRIFMLGSSVVWRGLDNESTICGRLESRVSSLLGSAFWVRCVNAGVTSAVSDQQLASLVYRVADLEPDLVIDFEGFNDLWCRNLEPRLGYPCNWFDAEAAWRDEVQRRNLAVEAVRRLPLWKLALSRSRLVTTFLPGLTLQQQATRSVADLVQKAARPTITQVADHLLANWRKMSRFSEGIGTKFVAILQPVAPGAREEGELATFYALLEERLAGAEARGEPFASFDRVLDERPDLFYDEVHSWDEANELYAQRMLELLIARNVLPTPAVSAAPERRG